MDQIKYEYVKHISHGAYGIVCSAFNKQLKQKVAIKKVKDAYDDLVDAKRILREIKLLSNLANKNSSTMRISSR